MKTLRAILVEDSSIDAEILVHELSRGGYAVHSQRVETAEQFESVLKNGPWDIIFCDYHLPQYSAEEALQLVRSLDIEVPFIVVSGAIGEEHAVAAMRTGVNDYLTKSNLARLIPVVERELREAVERQKLKEQRRQAEAALRQSEEHHRVLTECIPQLVWLTQPDGNIDYFNSQALRYVGLPVEEMRGWSWKQTIHPDDLERTLETWNRSLATGNAYEIEYRLRRADGVYRWHIGRAVPLHDAAGKIVRWFGTCTDVHEQKMAEEALQTREALFRSLIEKSYDGINLIDATGTILYASPSALRIGGRSADEVIGHNALEWVHPDDLVSGRQTFENFLKRPGETLISKYRFRHKDGSWRWVEATVSNLLHDPHVQALVSNFRDVTEQSLVEEQLRQSQKMEAIGQLAGGIAHDFNNLLTIINGFADIVSTALPGSSPLREPLQQIREAGERAAALTRQLLALSRKQVLAPKVLDLNQVVADVKKLLQRMIGEDIQLVTRLQSTSDRVFADPGQLGQVLINLAVNARDAMPQGGKLTIETRRADDDYVMLVVRDTGCGMTPAVKARAFEPFFTTKDVGKGTGLGLAVVHGIVSQSEGRIELDSEPGAGTTFRIYLPIVAQQPRTRSMEQRLSQVPKGKETILLVEDEDVVRTLFCQVLQEAGYNILEAANGSEAIHDFDNYPDRIHLLVTDVVMPGRGGRHVADYLLRSQPEMKVLFISGYTDDAVVRQGISHEKVNFLQKPFSPATLAQKIRQVLDSE